MDVYLVALCTKSLLLVIKRKIANGIVLITIWFDSNSQLFSILCLRLELRSRSIAIFNWSGTSIQIRYITLDTRWRLLGHCAQPSSVCRSRLSTRDQCWPACSSSTFPYTFAPHLLGVTLYIYRFLVSVDTLTQS